MIEKSPIEILMGYGMRENRAKSFLKNIENKTLTDVLKIIDELKNIDKDWIYPLLILEKKIKNLEEKKE